MAEDIAPSSQNTQSTQLATQQYVDPRKLGHTNSGLEDEDIDDVFCILVPASPPASNAAILLTEYSPQHTISTASEADGKNSDRHAAQKHLEGDTFGHAHQGRALRDIALRLSSATKSREGGFLFGRNTSRCDVVLGQLDATRKVSNIHFRIFINEYGIIMLEDQSTNGTLVDGVLLRGKDKENGNAYKHTLEMGSVIVIKMGPPEDDFRFLVRILQRDSDEETAFQTNLTKYFHRINEALRERNNRMPTNAEQAQRELDQPPPNIFANNVNNQENLDAQVSRVRKEWRGGQKYNKIGVIGKGAFAVVYKISTKLDGTIFAAKELEKRRFMKHGVLDQKIDTEMKIMSRITHAHIVQYVEHIDWEEHLYIIMEFVPGGDLGGLIHRRGCLQETEVQVMAAQLLSALKYLHGKGITHRDIKPDNILIDSLNPFHVKLTDFGLSKMVDTEETFLRTFCGTLLYCAPEVYSEYREYDQHGQRTLRVIDKRSLPPQRYGHAVDVWSLAGVLFFTLCGIPPYPANKATSYLEILNAIMTKPLDIRPLQLAAISDTGIRFIRSMLHNRPEYRATIEQLESDPWLTGAEEMQMSLEEDEVDMIEGDFVSSQLETGASQMSIRDGDAGEVRDSHEMPSDLTELQAPHEAPSSFAGSDSSEESYGVIQKNNGRGRLFGEVGVSAFGSSGAIPQEQLPVLINNGHHHPPVDQSSMETHGKAHDVGAKANSDAPHSGENESSMGPPKNVEMTKEGNPTVILTSLMGTESLVGHLNMQSGSAASPTAADGSPSASDASQFPFEVNVDTQANVNPGLSLRRQRLEDTDDEFWRPADLPAKRRRKSEREIDMNVPPSVFWDLNDKSTHHSNYPTMSTAQYENFKSYAAARGEKFAPGHAVFDKTMQSFRSSRSPSVEPELTTRANSYSRQTDEDHEERVNTITQRLFELDRSIPGTAPGSVEPEPLTPTKPRNITNILAAQPVVGNDFQLPKRILAKIIATSTSRLPTISLNVTETCTSWGRGFKNTVRYSDRQDSRIPKYAFKILLFKPGFYTETGGLPPNVTPGDGKNNLDEGMGFYISTKASGGLTVNNRILLASEPQMPNTPSIFWGELRHGDIFTIWNDVREKVYTQFRFECFWGKSKNARADGDSFSVLPPGEMLDEMEKVCLAQEDELLTSIARREHAEGTAQHISPRKIKNYHKPSSPRVSTT